MRTSFDVSVPPQHPAAGRHFGAWNRQSRDDRGLLRQLALAICVVAVWTAATFGITLAIASTGWLTGARTGAVPIPGIAGPVIRIPGALRTSDGGAIVLVGIGRRRSSIVGTSLMARVDSDGTLDLGYGYEGIASITSKPAALPTALAINPQTGNAWIGTTEGARSEILAIESAGKLAPGFGDHGHLLLPAVASGGVRALAWEHGKVLVAAGSSVDCAGCALTLLNATSGRPIAFATLTNEALGGSTCTDSVAVTSAAFAEPDELLVASQAADPHCSASLVELNDKLAPLRSGALSEPTGQPLRSVMVSSEPGATCVGGSGPAGIDTWPLGATRSTRVVSGASVRLVALVSIGGGGCGALIQSPGSAEVAQTDSNATAALTRIPKALAPLALFRCREHLLVLAASSIAGRQTAVIVPIPITQGPLAAVSAARASLTTGCQ